MFVHVIEAWLSTVPPLTVYGLLLLIVGVESMGIPMPGEIALVTASLLATRGVVEPWGVAIAASTGAIVGDSLGYLIGRRGGHPLLERLSARFPRHLGPRRIARAEDTFRRWGIWAVCFGRFVALLRILSGPIAGSLRMPYPRFLLANAVGGIAWATGTTLVVYYLGRVAERWLSDLSWVGLALAVIAAAVAFVVVRRRRAQRRAVVTDVVPAERSLP